MFMDSSFHIYIYIKSSECQRRIQFERFVRSLFFFCRFLGCFRCTIITILCDACAWNCFSLLIYFFVILFHFCRHIFIHVDLLAHWHTVYFTKLQRNIAWSLGIENFTTKMILCLSVCIVIIITNKKKHQQLIKREMKIHIKCNKYRNYT